MKGEREMREHEVAYCLIFATLCFFCGKPRIGIKLLTAGLLFHCPFPRTRVQLHSRGRKSPVGRHFLINLGGRRKKKNTILVLYKRASCSPQWNGFLGRLFYGWLSAMHRCVKAPQISVVLELKWFRHCLELNR